MASRITCRNCGAKFPVPAGFSRPKIRCSECGYYTEVPEEARAEADQPVEKDSTIPMAGMEATSTGAATQDRRREKSRASASAQSRSDSQSPPISPKERFDPRDRRPDFEGLDPAGLPLVAGTQEDDDGPYTVPGTGTKRCPHCNGELPHSAKMCVLCGRDLVSGKKKAPRKYQAMDRDWHEGWDPKLRLKVFGGAVVLDLILVIFANRVAFSFDSMAFALFVQIALQAFILGTYDRLLLVRNSKGKTKLTRVRMIGFIPMKPEPLAWQESDSVGIIATHSVGVFTWMVCLYLLTLMIVPGVVFYWMVIHPERFEVVACDVHGSTDEILFRTTGYENAQEVMHTIADATGLHTKKVI